MRRLLMRNVFLIAAAVMALPFLTPTSSECFGQGTMSTEDLLDSVSAVQFPSVGFVVNVTQTITKQPATATQKTAPVHSGSAEYIPHDGLRRVSSDESKSGNQKPTPKVMVDLQTFVDEVASYKKRSVDTVDLDGRSHALVEGSDSREIKTVRLWIDLEIVRISKVEFDVSGEKFAQIEVQYGDKQRDYWLPELIRLHHFTDDSEVRLEFRDYQFK